MENRKRNFFSILLLLGAGAFLALSVWWPTPKATHPRPQVRASSPQAQALINKHLWLASQTQEMTEKQRELENSYNRLQVGDSIWPKPDTKTQSFGVDHSPDRNETNAYEDLHRDIREFQASNPDHIIQGQLADEDRQKAYAEEYRAEYARQFVENARRHGYKVELNSDYVVVRVTRIPVPQQDRAPSQSDPYSGTQAQ